MSEKDSKKEELKKQCDKCNLMATEFAGDRRKICLHDSFRPKAPYITEDFICPKDLGGEKKGKEVATTPRKDAEEVPTMQSVREPNSKPPEPYNHKNCKKFVNFPKHATPIDCLNNLCSKECFIQKNEPREDDSISLCEKCWKFFIWACPLLCEIPKNIISCSAYEPSDVCLKEQEIINDIIQMLKNIPHHKERDDRGYLTFKCEYSDIEIMIKELEKKQVMKISIKEEKKDD